MNRQTICLMLVLANAWSFGLVACGSTPKERVVVKTVEVPVAQPCVSKEQAGEPLRLTDPKALAAMSPDERMQTAYAEWLGASARLAILEPIAKVCSEP